MLVTGVLWKTWLAWSFLMGVGSCGKMGNTALFVRL